eukprot:scaffold199299_cov36-Cyclotella_meneghiniana.AAC.2
MAVLGTGQLGISFIDVAEVAQVALEGNAHEMIPIATLPKGCFVLLCGDYSFLLFRWTLHGKGVVWVCHVAFPAPDIHARGEAAPRKQEVGAEQTDSILPDPPTCPASTLPTGEVGLGRLRTRSDLAS